VTDVVPVMIYDQPRIVAVIVVPEAIAVEIEAVPVKHANVYPADVMSVVIDQPYRRAGE
jgi:hypothetical protein